MPDLTANPDREYSLDVLPEQAGQRLDKLVASLLPELSRSYVQKLIEDGHVLVGSSRKKPSYPVRPGDVVAISVPPPESVEVKPQAIDISVVYEDDNVLVLDKPPGLVVHPAPGHPDGTLVNALLAHCPNLNLNGSIRPGIVHRLDKDTSGLMVVAKNDVAKASLIDQMKNGAILKEYAALLEGHLSPKEGIVDAPIGRDPRYRKKMAIVSSGRQARTEYRVIEFLPRHSLVQARLHTGRTHQIRVHFASLGHPVAGDTVYGSSKRRLSSLERQFLHAQKLGFQLPGTEAYREFTASLPSDLSRALEEARRLG